MSQISSPMYAATGIDPEYKYLSAQSVRNLQRAQGETACFMSNERDTCQNFQCVWRVACLRPVAEWRR